MPPRFVRYGDGSKKVWRGFFGGEISHLGFWCEGCNIYHSFQVRPIHPGDPVWTYNGDEENPTFSPSLVVEMPEGKRCHLFVRNGKIEYLSDCTHGLAGQTVEMSAEPQELADDDQGHSEPGGN